MISGPHERYGSVRLLAAGAALLAITTVSARGLPQAADAKQLFDDGAAAYQRGDYQTAVTLFEKSLQVRESSSARINLGASYEKLGRSSLAHCHSQVGLKLLATDDPDRTAAEAIVSRTAPLVGKVHIAVRGVAPGHTVELLIDSKPPRLVSPCVLEPELGKWVVPLDIGNHALEARAGTAKEMRTFTLAAGETHHLEMNLQQATQATPQTLDRKSLRTDWRWPTGFAVGGAGVAALIGGAVVGGLALDRNSKAVQECPVPAACNVRGVELAGEARSFGDISTALLAGGGAATGLGVILVLLGRPARATTASIRPVISADTLGASVASTF